MVIVSIFMLVTLLGSKIFNYLSFHSTLILPKGEIVQEINSPKDTYKAKVYRPGDTGDLRVDILNVETKKSRMIYWSWKESEVKIYWIDDENISINKKKLNILKDEYDKRNSKD